MQEMLEQMQEMRQRRIAEVWQSLDDSPQVLRLAERRFQEGQGNLLYARQKEEDILNRLSSNKELMSWVQARRRCQNRLLARALERAMQRALAEKWEEWEWEEWEAERNEREKEAESMEKKEWEQWKWGYVKWRMENNQGQKKEKEKEKESRGRENENG
jgi:hypothetical protein